VPPELPVVDGNVARVTARSLASDEVRWVPPHALGEYAMSTVGKKIVAVL